MDVDSRVSDLAVQDQVVHSASWGAAAFGPFYLLAMRAYAHAFAYGAVAALVIAADFYRDSLRVLGWLPLAGIVLAWCATVVGGKRVAWRTRRWRNFGDFLASQRVWDRWAKIALALVAGALGLDRLLETVAPPRGLRSRQILDRGILLTLSTVGAAATWRYAHRQRGRLGVWSRLGLYALGVIEAFVLVGLLHDFLSALYLPDAAEMTYGAAMFVAGSALTVAAWRYARQAPRLRWWVRLLLRAAVLPFAFVAAAGVLDFCKHTGMSDDQSTAAGAVVLIAGIAVAIWPALWQSPRDAARPVDAGAVRPAAPPQVHVRTALDAVALMARQPLLMAPILLASVIQDQLWTQVGRRMPAHDPATVTPDTLLRALLTYFWLPTLMAIPLHIIAVALVIYLTSREEQARSAAFGGALRQALVRFPASLAAYAVLVVRVVVGFVLLVIPGLVALVRGALVPQAVILGRAGPFSAVRISGDLLRGHWWKMFLLLAVEFIVAGASTMALGRIPYVGRHLAAALVGSWVAITLTLLYVRLGGTVSPPAGAGGASGGSP